MVKREDQPYVVMPNPFYQIYEGATLLAGAKPYFINCSEENGYLGDFDAVPQHVWQNTALLFVCTPGNPTGAVISKQQLKKLIALSDEYGFVIASDECYSELWFEQAPVGLLEVCAEMGRMIIKTVWCFTLYLNVLIYQVCVQALLQVTQYY